MQRGQRSSGVRVRTLLCAAALAALVACAPPTASVEVPTAELEARVADSVGDSLGVDTEVTCPQPLRGESGESTTCEVRTRAGAGAGGRTLVVPASVTVADVTDDGTLHLDISIEETPQESTPEPSPTEDAPAPAEDEASPTPAG